MVKEHPDTYRAGDVAGLSGLQARYDDQLRGTPGTLVQAVPAPEADRIRRRGHLRELFRADATAGRALRTTLDPTLQADAERILADVGPASALVALRPSHRRRAGRRQRSGQRRLQPGDLRAAGARIDVQERHQPGAAARRADPGVGGAVHAGHHRRRAHLHQLLRLPVRRDRADPAAHRAGQLLQHRLHLPGRPAGRERAGRRGGGPRARGRPRPRLPGVLRQRAAGRLAHRGGAPT